MAIGDDFSIAANGDIRYTGDAHGGAAPGYYSGIEFHRWLQGLADDAVASGDDLMDMTRQTPSQRSTDQIITLINGYNIDQTASEHLYDVSITQSGGDEIWDAVVNFGNATFIQIIQNGLVLTNDFWNTFSPSGFNADAVNGISHRFLVKVRDAGADIDNRRLQGRQSRWGKLWSYFNITATGRGRNVLALTETDDVNNQSTEVAVSGYTEITNIKEGYSLIDVNGDSTPEPYYSEWNLGGRSKLEFYERMKWLVYDGSTQASFYDFDFTANEVFLGVTHEIDIDTPTGTFVEPEDISWSGGTGKLLAIDSVTAGTKMYIQLITGVAPTDGQVITGVSTATATVNVTVRTQAINPIFLGQSTGNAILGFYGFGIREADLAVSDSLVDLAGNLRNPPNNVTGSLGGLVSGEDYVLVGLNSGGDFNFSQFTLNGALIGGETTIPVNEAVPSDLPTSGTIRVFDGTNYQRVTYTGFTGSSFTGCSGTPAASGGANLWVSYIDTLASAASESFNYVYGSGDRTYFYRVRDGGGSPIVTAEGTFTVGTGGGGTNVNRLADT